MSERMTGDIDILIDDDEGNRLKILNIIRNEVEQFDVHALNEEIKKRHKDEDYSALRFINNNDIVFDLMFRVGGMTYKELISYAENVDLENQNYVKTINEKGLFLTKCFSTRDKDLSDCRSLRAMIEKRFGEFPDLENNKVVFKVKQKNKKFMEKNQENVLRVFAPYNDGVICLSEDKYETLSQQEKIKLNQLHNKEMLIQLKPDLYKFWYEESNWSNVKIYFVQKRWIDDKISKAMRQLLFLKPIDSIISDYQAENKGYEDTLWYKVDMFLLKLEKFFIDRKEKKLRHKTLFGYQEEIQEEIITYMKEIK